MTLALFVTLCIVIMRNVSSSGMGSGLSRRQNIFVGILFTTILVQPVLVLLQVLTDNLNRESELKLTVKMSLNYLLMETLKDVLVVSVGGHWA